MALIATSLLCPFIVMSNIFTLKKHITKTHYNNTGLNVPDNAPLAIYQATLVGHWLIMGLKTDSSLVDMQLSKMEASIKNIMSLMAIGNFVVHSANGARGGYNCHSQGCIYGTTQVDHNEGQGGQSGYGDLGRHAQIGRTQAQPTPHGL
jgi:hypothetical protein